MKFFISTLQVPGLEARSFCRPFVCSRSPWPFLPAKLIKWIGRNHAAQHGSVRQLQKTALQLFKQLKACPASLEGCSCKGMRIDAVSNLCSGWIVTHKVHFYMLYHVIIYPPAPAAQGGAQGKRATPTTATISQQQQQPRQCWQGGGAKVHSGKGDPEGTLDLGTNHHWRRNPPFSGIVFRCGKGYFLEACSSTS